MLLKIERLKSFTDLWEKAHLDYYQSQGTKQLTKDLIRQRNERKAELN